MLKLNVSNASKVSSDIDSWLAAVVEETEEVAKGLATEAMITLLDNSPQFSGDFAANWKLSVANPDYSFQAGVFPKYAFTATRTKKKRREPFILGDQPAMQHAFIQAMGKMDQFKLGQTIWLTNSAEHLVPYAWMIEDNRIKFRPGNHGETVRITMDELRINYTFIDREKAMRLRGTSL